MNNSDGEHSLKYLGFFPVALASACLYVSMIYEAAKDQAGPLKPGVEDVEDMLKTVLRPILKIAEDNSMKLLDFVDKKVDEKLKVVDEHMPAFIKPIASHAQRIFMRGGPETSLNVKSLVLDGATNGHDREAFTEDWSYDSFRKFITILHLSGVVRTLALSIMYSAELFNHVGGALRERQIPFSSLIPDLPVQVLEKALKMRSDPTLQCCEWYECKGAC